MFIQKRKVYADDEIDENIDNLPAEGDRDVDVDPEATDLLFEAEDVAELVAEVTGQSVEVTVDDDDSVTFAVGEDEFTVAPEGNEEVLEASRKVLRGKKRVAASSRKAAPARRVAASTQRKAKPVRKVGRR